jgi:hypothetical protein
MLIDLSEYCGIFVSSVSHLEDREVNNTSRTPCLQNSVDTLTIAHAIESIIPPPLKTTLPSFLFNYVRMMSSFIWPHASLLLEHII